MSMVSKETVKHIKKSLPFFGMVSAFSLLSLVLIQLFIRQAGEEILNSWLENEAIQIQEGNFLNSLSRFSRTLLSSKIVTSVTLVATSRGPLEVLVSYGDQFDLRNVCGVPSKNEIHTCTKGIFHEVFVYSPLETPDFILVFETKPNIAFEMFAIVLFSASLVSLVFMKSLQRILKRESSEREFLVRAALEELMSSTQPSEILLRDFPTIAEKWQEMQNLLSDMRLEIERASKAEILAKIAQNMAHDLRAPLGTFERLLLTPDEKLPGMRGAVRDSLGRLNSMIESLRHSEIESLVHRTRSSLNFRYGEENLQAKCQKHSVQIEVPQEPLTDIWIDAMKVERSWINLAANGIEAAKSYVKVEAEKHGRDLLLRVIDDGFGIPDEVLPRLFLRGMTYGKADGTGLGLAYVKQIMQGHGGEVTYRREDGLTIFECRISQAYAELGEGLIDREVVSDKRLTERKRVVVALLPTSLAIEVCEDLNSFPTKEFMFSSVWSDDLSVIVSNDDEVLFKAMDDNMKFIQISKTLDRKQIVDRIALVFELEALKSKKDKGGT